MKEDVEKSKRVAKQIIDAEGYCTAYSKSVCFDCPCYPECGLNSNTIDKHNRIVTCNKYLNEHKEVQHTICAVCRKDKPTPIRNDTMGGYVCMTCVDKELERLQRIECKQNKEAVEKKGIKAKQIIEAKGYCSACTTDDCIFCPCRWNCGSNRHEEDRLRRVSDCIRYLKQNSKIDNTVDCTENILTKRETIVVSLIQGMLASGDVRQMSLIVREANVRADIILESFEDYK